MPSDSGEIVLGVDLDGVCADFYTRMREIAAEWFERDIAELTTTPSFSLAEWGIRDIEHYKQLHQFAVTQRNLFETCPKIPGAAPTLRKLSDEGYRIRIITHRLFIDNFHEAAVTQTVRWLEHHGIRFKDLCFMREKDQVGADVYIDDTPVNIEALRAAGHYAIVFANSTNMHLADPRAANWEEVYALIKAKYPNPRIGAGS